MIAEQFLDPRWPTWPELIVSLIVIALWMVVPVLVVLVFKHKAEKR